MWQKFYVKHRGDNFEILSIAVDVQGAEVVKPYPKKFGVTFPVAVDPADVFGQAFGLKAIPDSFLVDEVGIIRLHGNGPEDKLLKQIEAVLKEPLTDVRGLPPPLTATGALTTAAQSLQHHQKGDALAALKEALKHDPDNWRIRKQIWAIEHPEKFYSGDSPDYDWQKEELAREKAAK